MTRAKVLVTGMLMAMSFAACDKGPVEQSEDPQVTLSADSVIVNIGASTSVGATVLHSTQAALYVSRDQTVATVNPNGMITGVKAGTTYVIATLANVPNARDSVRVRVPAPPPPQVLKTGVVVPEMVAFDSTISAFMLKFKIPGGAVAVMRAGKLIYARGFGYADVENNTPAQPDALFRIASMSKPITSAAIMKLVEEGKLGLDDFVAPIIADLKPADPATFDPRWNSIRIRHLLNHTGGWDRGKPNGGFDPIDRPLEAAAEVGAPAPASPETLIRYMMGKQLDFFPGEKIAYSNFGYIVLGRVIERVSGMPYAEYVRTRVLAPVGANRTQQGKSRMKDALPGEVKYYFDQLGVNAPLVQSVFPGEGMVPLNYGGYHHEAGDASGAWVSSTVDLLRFLGGVDGRSELPDILSPATIATMTGSGPSQCPNFACYYAYGWWVRPIQGQATWWHGGTLPGATGMLVRTHDNFSMVALFNMRHGSAGLEQTILDALTNALAGVTSFPTHDLFSTFQ